MFSFKPRRALLPTVSWGASLSPLKKRASTSVRVRAPKAAGGATLLTIKSTTRAGKRGVRTSARIQPRAWSFAPVLLAAVLAACGQVDASKSTTAQASAAPAASRAASAASAAQGAGEFPSLTPEAAAVKKRAQERWDALVVRDFERAWTYLEPDARKEIEQKDYKTKFGDGGIWLGAEVLNAKCITARCAALVRLNTQVLAPGFPQGKVNATTHFDEEWVLQDGQWWYRGLRKLETPEGEEPLPSATLPRRPKEQPASGAGSWGGSTRR